MAACVVCGHDPWKSYFAVTGEPGDTNDEAVFAPCEHERAAREIEETVGCKKVHVEERPLGGGWVDAYCCAFGDELSIAIHEDLPEAHVRARVIEAHGLSRFVPRELWRRLGGRMISKGMWLSKAEEKWNVSTATVLAISSVIADMEPEWVERVKEARRYADDEKTMAAWTELPLQVVMGVLYHLKATETALA